MTHRHFIFDFQESLEAAGLFLQLAGGRMRFIRLIKLLYIADRVCLEMEARTITGDKVCAMPHGPVLNTVYSLIKGREYRSQIWQHFIKTEGHEVYINNDPGVGYLCRFEKELIANVYNENKNKDVVRLSHTFPEWKKYENQLKTPGLKKSYPITIIDMLDGIGKPELLPVAIERIEETMFYNELLGDQLHEVR
ncbi:MAG: Panacea domain-containing protein [Thermoguttaceae bacterium]